LQKGKVLSEEDIRLKQTRKQNLSGYFTKASDVVGRTLKKTLSVNQVLLSRHLEIYWDIRKGQKIIMQSTAGPVTIENSGVAQADAQVGELLKVENEQSGKIVEGIVVSRKKIRILTK
jgi:flagella basal body P-ring formation protein FlgA